MQTILEQARQAVQPRFSVETITPNLAAQYLARNSANRPLKRGWVATLAAAMQRGEWRLNGEAIKFADDGRLLDGQNRLHAVIRSGLAQPMVVARGLDATVFDTLDQGVKRGANDVLAIAGEKNAASLAAVSRVILGMEQGGVFNRVWTLPQIEATIASHPTVCDWIRKFIASKAHVLAPSALPAVLTLGAELHGAVVADDFLHKVATGEHMAAKHPAMILRARLIEARASKIKRLRQEVVAAFAVKAWNAYVADKTIGILRFDPADEQFPVLK